MNKGTRVLAASFVVTVSACKESRSYSPPHLFEQPDGTCAYMNGFSCPADATCNPPGPRNADCPGAASSDPHAAARPGWVRIKESVGAYNGSCSFVADYFCPHPDQKTEGSCETAVQNPPLVCKQETEGQKKGWHHIEGFTAKRAGGVCVQYASFWCKPGCDVPIGAKVDCRTGAVITPAPKPDSAVIATGAAPSARPSARPSAQGTQNPTDADGRPIRRAYSGAGCFVYLPFPPLEEGEMRPPGSEPPRKSVTCPALMATPTFEQCRGGTVLRAGEQCTCHVGGNPPPPPRDVPCPP